MAEQLLPQARADGAPLSLLLMDVDAFLAIQREFGRECSDTILNTVVEHLQVTCQEGSVLSRYGGDEFAVALPEMRLDHAFTVAEDVRRVVASLAFSCCPQLAVTCSTGPAS